MLDEGPETATPLHDHLALVFAQVAGGVGDLLQVHQFHGAAQVDLQGIILGSEARVGVAHTDIGSVATDAHGDHIAVVLAQGAGQFEEVHGLLEGDGTDALVLAQAGEAGLLLIVGLADLDHGPESADAGIDLLAAHGVNAQFTCSCRPFSGLAHRADGGVEGLVEAGDHLAPVLLSLGDHVELLLHLGGEVEVHHRGEVLHQEIVHHHADVGGEQLLLLGTHVLGGRALGDLVVRQGKDAVVALGAFPVLLHHVVLFLHGADRGRVGGRTADAEFLQFLHQAGLRVPRRGSIEALRGGHLAHAQVLALFHIGQQAFLLLAVLIVLAFHVHLEEAVEEDHLTGCFEGLSGPGADGDVHHGLLQFGIGHLAGEGTLPDEVVQPFGIAVGTGIAHHHVRRADGLVRLLGTLALAGVAAALAVARAVLRGDLRGGRCDGAFTKVHRIGTHVGDVPLLIEPLGDPHGAVHTIAELPAGLLLQGGGGEGRGGRAFAGLLLHGVHRVFRTDAALQERHGLGLGGEAGGQFGLHL